MSDLSTIAQALFSVGAFKTGAFKLKLHRTNPDAPKSPYYINMRTDQHPIPEKRGPVTQEVVELIAERMIAIIKENGITFDLIVAVPYGAVPYAEAIARRLGKPLIRLHKTDLENGDTKVSGFEDDPEPYRGQTALLIEDVVTTGASSIETLDVLAKADIFADEVLCVCDREEGGEERLVNEIGALLWSTTTLTQLLEYGSDHDLIDHAKFDECRLYHDQQSRQH